jgi:hypothetical protein
MKVVGQLGARPASSPVKWYQFSRSVAVCPHCSAPVRHSKKGQAWLLFAFPFLLALVIEAATIPLSYVSRETYWTLFGLAILGSILFRLTTRLEKAHAA